MSNLNGINDTFCSKHINNAYLKYPLRLFHASFHAEFLNAASVSSPFVQLMVQWSSPSKLASVPRSIEILAESIAPLSYLQETGQNAVPLSWDSSFVGAEGGMHASV